jgi:hypothetical protein
VKVPPDLKLQYRALTGLLETFRRFVNNEPWWRGIMDVSRQRWIESMQSESNP